MMKGLLRGILLGLALGVVVTTATPDKAQGESTSQAGSSELTEARELFLDFAIQWLEKANFSYRYTPDNAELLDRDGAYVARYHLVDLETLSVRVKPSSHQSTPYVGLMRYVEYEYECPGQTPQAARTSPCFKVRGSRVTEIFRFAEGRWLGE
jgi:hypothetical protein